MSSTAKKTLTVTAHAQIAVVFLAFALMVSLSSWFMNNILRKHLVYNAQMVLNGLETQIEVDLLEPRTILGSLSQTARSCMKASRLNSSLMWMRTFRQPCTETSCV